jgi:hypothetical protein
VRLPLEGNQSCQSHDVRFYGRIKNPVSIKEIVCGQNSGSFSCLISPAFLLDVCSGNCQRALVDKSGMIRNQIGTHSSSEMVTVQRLPCMPAP